MHNFLQRTLFGIIFVVIIAGSILLSPLLFALVLLAVTIIGLNEVISITIMDNEKRGRIRPFLLAIGSSFFLLIALVALGYLSSRYLMLATGLFFMPFLHALFERNLKSIIIFSSYYPGLLLVALPSALMLFLFNKEFVGEAAGPYLVLTMLVMIWINDTFAYLVGIWLGKNRLFERISPKKSWEGSVGGLVFTLIAAYFWAQMGGLLAVNEMLILALIVVVFSTLGDLVESMLKRQAGVKDTGRLIPGHGGILDRFDATFFVTPFVVIYLSIIN
jgi:phosphatidate cytidylyltransferase